MSNEQQSGVDAMTAFWRDVWAKSMGGPGPMGMGAGGVGSGGMPGMGAMPTPDMARRMQSAFYEAMAQAADQYMRSPQFLDAMKRSMDQALQFRKQMDDFLRVNMASTFETAGGGVHAEILDAIRQVESRLNRRLDDLADRLDKSEGQEKPRAASGGSAGKRPTTRRH